MIEISVRHDLSKAIARLNRLQREQLPFATAKALTRTAQDVQTAIPPMLKRVLEAPVPFTTRAPTFVVRAEKRQWPACKAVVAFKDRQAAYLAALLKGGGRELKRVETKFKGRAVVPGVGIELDRYGNVPKKALLAIVRAADNGGRGYAGGTVFVGRGKSGQLADGVYAVQGRALCPLLYFVDSPRYRRTIPLRETASEVVRARWAVNFNDANAWCACNSTVIG